MRTLPESQEHGFSLPELLTVLAILGLITLALYYMVTQGYELNQREVSQILVQEQARASMEQIKPEVRHASDAVTGAYVIDTATPTTFVFYSDVDDDGITERVRYQRAGTTIERGITEAEGTPPTYTGAESVTLLATDVINDTVFTYFDGSYNGSGSALSSPIDVTAIRLVGITLTLDPTEGDEPPAFTLSERIQLRNSKDNL